MILNLVKAWLGLSGSREIQPWREGPLWNGFRNQGDVYFKDVLQSNSMYLIYESIATVGEICVWLRADFQSGSGVLKKVF